MKQTLTLFFIFTLTILNAQKVAQFSFDGNTGETITIDSVSQAVFNINNHFQRPERIAGIKGNALRLDGWTTWASKSNTTFPTVTNEMTVEVWHATECFTKEAGGLVSQIAGPTGFSLEVTPYGEVIWAFHATGQFYLLQTTTQLEKYQWNHIVATIDLPNQVAKIYINGVEEATQTLGNHNNIVLVNNGTPLFLGRQTNLIQHNGIGVSVANGAIDEVAIYNDILSPTTILNTYNQYANTSVDLTIDPDLRHAGDYLRPQYHVMPNTLWTNEAYGLIYYNHKYHLFSQKNPNGPDLYFMHWGHYSSPDLTTWTEEKIAIAPDRNPGFDDFGCWSGTMIFDNNGTPQLFYTGVDGVKAGIGMASPLDSNLVEWSKHPNNPLIVAVPTSVLNLDFRDPFLWEENGTYYMIVGSGKAGNAGGLLFQFQSTDLVNWTEITPFYQASPNVAGIFWEMPFLYKINATEYILSVTPTPHNVRAKTIYWVGTIQNNVFVPNNSTPKDFELITENFLSPAIGVDSLGQPTYIGIIPEDRSVADQIAAGWRQTLSLPRVLELLPNGKLAHQPHPNLERLRRDNYQITNRTITTGTTNNLPEIRGNQMELQLKVTPSTNTVFTLQVYKHLDEQEVTSIVFNPVTNKIIVDRINSTLSDALKDSRQADYNMSPNQPMDIRVYLDHSILEIFVDDTEVFSCRVYPSREASNRIDLIANAGTVTIDTLDAWQIDNNNPMFTGIILSTENAKKNEFLNDFSIVPNPNNGHFEVQFDKPITENVTYKVYNAVGKIIAESNEPFFNLDLPKGVYFLELRLGEVTEVKRFVVY